MEKRFCEFVRVIKFILAYDANINLEGIPEIEYPGWPNDQYDKFVLIMERFFIWRACQIKNLSNLDWYKIEIRVDDVELCDEADSINFPEALHLVGYWYMKYRSQQSPMWGENINYEDVKNVFVIDNREASIVMELREWVYEYPETVNSDLPSADTPLKEYLNRGWMSTTVDIHEYTHRGGCISKLFNPRGCYTGEEYHWHRFDTAPLLFPLMQLMETKKDDSLLNRLSKIVWDVLSIIPGYPLKDIPCDIVNIVLSDALAYFDCIVNDTEDVCFINDNTMEEWETFLQKNITRIEKYVGDLITEAKKDHQLQ
nr:MAG TPA: hypothetical protein [Caudoviricetes sp.]